VCKAGGDGAIAFANGYGMWIKATVIKRTGVAAAPAPAAAPVASAPAAAIPAAASGAEHSGCSYDTQCKGDRICEAGRCVSPTLP
jgi:hypothetical protein